MASSGKINFSRQGQGCVAGLAVAAKELFDAFSKNPSRVDAAIYQAARFRQIIDDIDGMGVLAGEGGGEDVPAEDAARTGLLLYVDPYGAVSSIDLKTAATVHLAGGLPFVISGAGTTLANLLSEVPSWRGGLGMNGLVVQFVGIDPSHWAPSLAEPLLEINLLQAAAMQLLNGVMNAFGKPAVVISQGFGCWVANRALLLLSAEQVWHARNLQFDALGPPESMVALTSAKKDGFGTICHVQSSAARSLLHDQFGLSETTLAALPVDLQVNSGCPRNHV